MFLFGLILGIAIAIIAQVIYKYRAEIWMWIKDKLRIQG
jgi:hypothetical protein